MPTLNNELWPIVEASLGEPTLADDEVILLPKELVEKFLNEFLIPHPRAFAIVGSEVVTPFANTHDASSSAASARVLKVLVRAGAAGFELIVGTTQSPKQVIDWFRQHRYQIVAEQRVASSELFDGMFPTESVDLALDSLPWAARGALVGFAHDADPIWIVG